MLPLLAVVLALTVAGLAINGYLARSAAQLEEKLALMQELVGTDDWDAAQQVFAQFSQRWEDVQRHWAILINHQEIDELQLLFGRIEQYIIAENRALALAELEAARLLVRHIPEKENVNLTNIL
jgi:hypothetical protein